MKVQKTRLNFRAGMTPQIKQEIASCNPAELSFALQKNGIYTDFKGNKVIAWCTQKCIEIIRDLNKKYNLKLGLPSEVFVEDFESLRIKKKDSLGITNVLPARLYKRSNVVIPENTICFNEFQEYNSSNGNSVWDNIDRIIENQYKYNITPTDNFLDIFLHEFSHIIHAKHLRARMSDSKFHSTVRKSFANEDGDIFRERYGPMLSRICDYAAENPFEAVACDLSKHITLNLDKTLMPQNNPFTGSPYMKTSFWNKLTDKQRREPLFQILAKFWDGKISL